MRKETTTCCIAGGGPAGIMAGFLLARAGVEVIVLEKHPDFFRDFRGDTIHPSTLELMHELGISEELLKIPNQKVAEMQGSFGDTLLTIADFRELPVHHKFIAFMPQWDFLNFLTSHARRFPAFHLLLETTVTDLIEEGGRITGLHADSPAGPIEIKADLVIGADGRHSKVRERANLIVEDRGAPIDVLWFRISRRESDPDQTMGRFNPGNVFVLLYRGEFWQCGLVIPKGGYDALRRKGLPAVREIVAHAAPVLADRIQEITGWDDLKLLTVKVDHLRQWYRPGLLCIGDAAHAMSPVGGIGINLAIQDAVAAANILAEPLRTRTADENTLRAVQRRRAWPTALTQRLQIVIQERIISQALASKGEVTPPLFLRIAGKLPLLRRMMGRIMGLGFRPEHVRTPMRRPEQMRSSAPSSADAIH